MKADTIGIVGAGVVGSVAALSLARRGYAVLLLERTPPPVAAESRATDAASWPLRHVALGADSVALLDSLGVTAYPYGVFEQITVWEALGTGAVSFTAAEAGLSSLGRMAELPALTRALWEAVLAEPGIEVVSGRALADLETTAAATRMTLDDGSVRTLAFVLGTDGARSRVRTLLGQPPSVEDTGHHALVTVVRTAQPHDRIARQRFLPGGPLALLPMQYANGVSVVWSQSQADAQRRLDLPEAAFMDELSVATDQALGAIEAVGGRGCFPIRQTLAASFLPSPRVMLLGDAARVVHPLAGLGVNLGLDDVQLLLEAFDRGSLPAPGALRRWARRRKARSWLVQRTLTALQQLYGADGPRLSLLRNLGVRTVDASSLLRQLFIHEALGADRRSV